MQTVTLSHHPSHQRLFHVIESITSHFANTTTVLTALVIVDKSSLAGVPRPRTTSVDSSVTTPTRSNVSSWTSATTSVDFYADHGT